MKRAETRSEERTRSVVMLGFPHANIIDVSGPLEVFANANRVLDVNQDRRSPRYRTQLVAHEVGPILTTSGLELMAQRALRDVRGPIDTLVVPGGDGSRAAIEDRALITWIRRSALRARRVTSVCTGALLLAEAGLLDGRRAVTHWASCELLAKRYPAVHVESDPIFVRDGKIWSSAGVCAGMDLALALVEADHGRDVALTVARWMVIFLKRPGGQSQFSVGLVAQATENERIRELQAWAQSHVGEDLGVARLAKRVAMSPRNFSRVFLREVGETPAHWVEGARIETARRLLEDADDGVDAIASRCGFGTAETLRRAFTRRLGVAPSAYRARFRSPAA